MGMARKGIVKNYQEWQEGKMLCRVSITATTLPGESRDLFVWERCGLLQHRCVYVSIQVWTSIDLNF